MELVLIVVLVVGVLGHLAGRLVTKLKIRKIRQYHFQKPLYNIQGNLSPAEFGYIIDGTIGPREWTAEIILLTMQGHIKLKRLPSGAFNATKTLEGKTPLTSVQVTLLKSIDNPGADDIAALEYEVTKSLRQKGWIMSKKPPLRGLSKVPLKYIIIGFIINIIVCMATLLAGKAFDVSGEALYVAILLVLTVEAIVSIIAGFVIVFRGEMLHNARFIMTTTTKYKQQWKDAYGVYEYIRVSGMDIFTPDYETMNFKGLDPLYAYAVAAGFDKKVVKLIVSVRKYRSYGNT
jgi:hypothetical protein